MQPPILIGVVAGAILAASGFAVWRLFCRAGGRKAAFLIVNRAPAIPETKVPVLSEMLRIQVGRRGFSAVRSKGPAAKELFEARGADDTEALKQTRALGAEYLLVVAI